MMSPYHEALEWVLDHPGTSGASGLAKLLLSIRSPQCAFALSECVGSLDARLSAIALRAITHYIAQKIVDDSDLDAVCQRIREVYPRLEELGLAATAGKRQQERDWELIDALQEGNLDG